MAVDDKRILNGSLLRLLNVTVPLSFCSMCGISESLVIWSVRKVSAHTSPLMKLSFYTAHLWGLKGGNGETAVVPYCCALCGHLKNVG